MHVSEHYPAFTKKTLLVLTNNELARLIACHDRFVEEVDVISTPETAVEEPTPSAPASIDAAKHHRREELYVALSDTLREHLKKDAYAEILLCTPEANKNELLAALHEDVAKRVKNVIPKNLASMELHQVLRILLET